jgi:peptide/nickel transport system substrate-binding protein
MGLGRSSKWWLGGAALVAVLGLTAAACGGDDSDSSSETTAAAASTTAATAATTAGSAETTAASAGTTAASTGAGGDLRIAVSMADLATLDPPRAFADINGMLQPLYGEPLVVVDQANPTEILPAVAESWEVSDDGLTYTFTLRDDITFSTGNPLTADDVVFTFQRLKNLQGPVAFILDGMADITAVDDTTVEITLSAPDSAFLAKITNGALMILDSKTVTENGGVADETAVDADKAQEFLDENTVGSGPYVLKEWQRNQRAVFEPNPSYNGKFPAQFDTVTFLDVREPATQRQLLEGGDADLAANLDPDTAEGISDSDITVDTVPSVNLIYLALNNKDGISPMSDPKVRQAIQKAIDYDGISALTGGATRPAAVIPLGLQGIDKVDVVETDVDGAKALLEEAGQGSGFGFDVTFANYAPYGVPLTTLWEKLKADFAEVGIDVTLKPVEYDAWLQAYRTGELPMTSSIWAPDFLDVTNYLDVFARPDGLVTKRIGMNVPELGTLYDQIVKSTDPAEREELAAQSGTLMRDDASLIPLVQPNSTIAYRDGFQGVKYSPNHQIEVIAIKPA